MRLERSITVLAAAVLAGWLLAVLLCNGLFYRNIVNYEIMEWQNAGLRQLCEAVPGKFVFWQSGFCRWQQWPALPAAGFDGLEVCFWELPLAFAVECFSVFWSGAAAWPEAFCFWRPVSLRIWLICPACSCFWSVEDRTGLCRRTGFFASFCFCWRGGSGWSSMSAR